MLINSNPTILYRQTCQLTFVADGSKEVGTLDWSTGFLRFEGFAEESARIFFEYVLKAQIDQYINYRMSEARTKVEVRNDTAT